MGPGLGLLSVVSVVGINSKVLTKSTALSPLVAIFTSLRERLIDFIVAKLNVLQNNIFLFVQCDLSHLSHFCVQVPKYKRVISSL